MDHDIDGFYTKSKNSDWKHRRLLKIKKLTAITCFLVADK